MTIDPRLPLRSFVAVFVGGAFGTAVRLVIDLWMPQPAFPLATLVVNVTGSLALGVLVARVWPRAAPWLRAGLGAGLLGSFTTYSAFAVSLVALGAASNWPLAAAYLAATVVLGLLAAWAGLRLGGTSANRMRP